MRVDHGHMQFKIVTNRDELSVLPLKIMTFVRNTVTKQNVINRDLFRIDRSSYMGPCHYGKSLVTTNVAKFWLHVK